MSRKRLPSNVVAGLVCFRSFGLPFALSGGAPDHEAVHCALVVRCVSPPQVSGFHERSCCTLPQSKIDIQEYAPYASVEALCIHREFAILFFSVRRLMSSIPFR